MSTGGSSKKSSKASGGNRPIMLVLAGATALTIVAIAIIAIVNASGGGGGSSAADRFTPVNDGLIPVGDKAPDFTAETTNGQKVSLADKGGQPATMLVFFATWCPHCQREAPIVSDLEGQYKDLRVVMLGIDGQDNPQKVQQFADEYDISSPAVYKPEVGTSYDISGYPTVYVLDGQDQVVGASAGEVPRDVVEGWIEDAL